MIDPRAEMDKFRPAAFMGDANPLLTNLSGPGRSSDAGKQQNVGHSRSWSFEDGMRWAHSIDPRAASDAAKKSMGIE